MLNSVKGSFVDFLHLTKRPKEENLQVLFDDYKYDKEWQRVKFHLSMEVSKEE